MKFNIKIPENLKQAYKNELEQYSYYLVMLGII